MTGHWPAGVPRDYKELQKEYGDFIAYVCQRYGRVEQSPADLLQHIWERLLNADVLAKYVTSLQTGYTVPDTVTTLEACALLGISFGAWRSAQWSYNMIFRKVLGGVAPTGGKNRGVTKARHARGERWVLWMPDPVVPKGSAPEAKPKSPYSTSACFNTRQVITLVEMGLFRNVCVNLPTPTATPAHFKNYLRQAVKNHWKNWCRTKKRRHKERPADLFAEFKPFDEGKEGGMEERLVDQHATNRMEAMADIAKILGRAQTSELIARKDDLFALLDDGYNLAEAVKKLSLSAATKRAVEKALKTIADG